MKNIDELINKLTIKEKVDLVSGYKSWMTSPIKRLDIPSIYLTDGPIGVRKKDDSASLGGLGLGKSFPSTSFPTSVNLANSFNNRLAYNMGKAIGQECEIYNVNVLLGPAMNIKRDPRCGRNFEYFSEDPVVSGKIASAVVKGVQSQGVSACPKHFACNSQETNRSHNDSRVSERALREIYLKGFKIVVEEAKPHLIMTSYNRINSVLNSNNYDLTTSILRREWGYKGLITTDWWMVNEKSPDFEGIYANAYRIRAQVDVLMPGGDRVKGKGNNSTLKALNCGALTRGELQRGARNVLNFILNVESTKGKI